MSIRKIYLDVDDTLNMCTMFMLKVNGCDVGDDLDQGIFDPGWGYNIVKAANVLSQPGTRITKRTFWDSVSRDDWATIPYSYEYSMIVNSATRLVGKSKVALLTKPINDPECYAGKSQWIMSHCAPWLRKRHFIGMPKCQLAEPESLLIDDSDAEFEAWTAAGGQAILVPRPWNQLWGYYATEYLNLAFAWARTGDKLPQDPKVIAFGKMERVDPVEAA